MRRALRLVVPTALLVAAACGEQASPIDDSLRRDLDVVGAQAVELAPAGRRTQVVSAIEQTGTPEPAPARTAAPAPRRSTRSPSVRPASAPRRAPVPIRTVERTESEPAPAPAVEPTRVAESPAPVPAPRASAPEPAPAPLPAPERPPRGGWKTVGEVIRNAPFPILP